MTDDFGNLVNEAGLTAREVFWGQEVGYILSIRPGTPGAAHNHDPDCFIRYCDMQIASFERDRAKRRVNPAFTIGQDIIDHYTGA